MVISEKTKQAVARCKSSLRQRYDANTMDINEHKDAIEKIRALNVSLKAEYDALDADIPEPTPTPDIMEA